MQILNADKLFPYTTSVRVRWEAFPWNNYMSTDMTTELYTCVNAKITQQFNVT